MTTPASELIAFSASATLALEEHVRVAVIASVHVDADGAVRVLVETEETDEPLELLSLPAGSRVAAAASSGEVAA